MNVLCYFIETKFLVNFLNYLEREREREREREKTTEKSTTTESPTNNQRP